MSGKLVFPTIGVSDVTLGTVTDQAGLIHSAFIPDADNDGAMVFTPSGTPTAAMDVRVKIGVAGNVGAAARFLGSIDGGTNYLGRLNDDEVWDGNGAASREIDASAGAHTVQASRPVYLPPSPSGTGEGVFVAVTVGAAILIRKTADLEAAVTWETVCADTGLGADSGSEVQMFAKGTMLLLLYKKTVGGRVQVWCSRSKNRGVTWLTGVVVDSLHNTATSDPRNFDGCLLASGRAAVVYNYITASNTHVYIKTSANGTSWSTAKLVTPAGGSPVYQYPGIVQNDEGKTIVFSVLWGELTTTYAGRQNTASDPATGTWATYSDTTTTLSGFSRASFCIAPDKTIYCAGDAADSADDLYWSKLNKGSGAWSALEVIVARAGVYRSAPMIANIGGALWCVNVDITNNDVDLHMCKYWTTYSATAQSSWTGTDAQYFKNGLWLAQSGSGAVVDDFYDMLTDYNYSAYRMFALRPKHPTRSLADGSAWVAVYDLGADSAHAIDMICAMSNLAHFHLQMNATDSWGAPSVDTTVSFVRETIASGGYTVAAGKITRSAGAWVPGRHAGEIVRVGSTLSSAVAYRIRDNDAASLYVDGITSGSGDLNISSKRAWIAQTSAAYRYLRVSIDAQQTPEGYYDLPALLLGLGLSLRETDRARMATVLPAEDSFSRNGDIQRACADDATRRYLLSLLRPSLAAFQELSARHKVSGQGKVGYIQDVTNAFDWALCFPAVEINWNSTKTDIRLDEVAG